MRRRRRRSLVISSALASTILASAHVAAGQATQLPSTVYIWPMGNFAQNAMMSSLAGVVNRSTNGELLLSPNNGAQPNPRFWLDQLKAAYPQVQSTVQSSASTLITQYRSKLTGYVLYDTSVSADSINVATSIAGVTDAIIVDPSTQLTAQLAGLPMVADARNMTYTQAYTTYGPQFNKDLLFHQNTTFAEQLRDYAVMNRGFVYWSNPTQLAPYAANQNPQGRIYGWANSEQAMFSQASAANQQVVASDYSWSTSTTSRWKIPIAQQSSHAAPTVATNSGKHYVAFVMSDGDNTQWLMNGFATDPKWFGSPYRGTFNMTWDYSPSLQDQGPIAHNYLYQHASNGTYKDNFVAAGGAGTAFPSQTPDIAGLADSINESMVKADLRVTSILDPTYDTSKLFPILDEPQVTGMMYKAYDNFYRRAAAIDWHNGKPIVSVKYSLWDGADSAQSLAAALNADTHRDANDDVLSYDIVNVHPWSVTGPDGTGSGDPMSNLHQLMLWLDPSKVQVVTLEELMVQLRNHFGTPITGALVNAAWKVNSNGVWSSRSNWSGALPNFIDTTVNFGSAINSSRTITLDQAVTAGTINFDNAASSYTLAGTRTITLDTTAGVGQINLTHGSHTITAPLLLADDATIAITDAGGLLTINNLQTTTRSLSKTGPGVLAVNRVRAGALNVNAGTLRIIPNRTALARSIVNSLTVADGATLDLSDNKLVIAGGAAAVGTWNGSAYTGLTSLIVSGRDGGSWTGDGIITSQSAAVNSNYTTLGVGVSAGDAIVMYTYGGDATLDGKINIDDYVRIDNGIAGGLSGWSNGDFNYDGKINIDDYTTVIDANIGNQTGTFSTGSDVVAIPEPAWGLTTLALYTIGVMRRRRQR